MKHACPVGGWLLRLSWKHGLPKKELIFPFSSSFHTWVLLKWLINLFIYFTGNILTWHIYPALVEQTFCKLKPINHSLCLLIEHHLTRTLSAHSAVRLVYSIWRMVFWKKNIFTEWEVVMHLLFPSSAFNLISFHCVQQVCTYVAHLTFHNLTWVWCSTQL